MRPAVTMTAIALVVSLSACGDSADDPDGPERRTAAGEVLGGDASDAMLPVDSVRSTAPAAPRTAGSDDGDRSDAGADKSLSERRAALPEPEMSGGPEPLPGGTEEQTDTGQ